MLVSVLVLGCELEEPAEVPVASIAVIDAPERLSSSSGDPLFVVRLCDTGASPATYPVSGLHAEIEAQGVEVADVWSLRYELTVDLDGDARFGPGDEVAVGERDRDVLGEGDRGTYRVTLRAGTSEDGVLLGIADWVAR